MKIDKLIAEDGFTYCCKAIPIKTIKAEEGFIFNTKTQEINRKQITLYKHYIYNGQILEEPICDEDTYVISGGRNG